MIDFTTFVKESQNFDFFVYCFVDVRKPGKFKYFEYEFDYEPFYIGKGSGSRPIRHFYLCGKMYEGYILW